MPREPTPASVQPEVPRQLVFAPVEVSVSSQTGRTLKELLIRVIHFSGQDYDDHQGAQEYAGGLKRFGC
jgi:hypothetical protein